MKRRLQNGSKLTLLVVVSACSNIAAPPARLRVMIVPSSVTADRGQTVFLSVAVKDAGGTSVVPDSVQWTSSDTTKATVSASGVLRTIQGTNPTVTVQATAFKGRSQGSGTIPVEIPAFP